MALTIPKTCAMGSSQTALVGTIGVALLSPDGSVHTARATAGIYEIGGGCYGKNISFPDNWVGVLKWDTGGGSPVYAVEEYTVDGLVDAATEDLDDIKGTGFVKDTDSLVNIKDNLVIRSGTVSAVVSQYLEFNTNLSEVTNDYWVRGAIRFTSGNNEGAIRKIQLYQGSNGYIKLRTPLVNSIQTGDTFDIIPLRAFRINHEDVEQIVDETLDEVIASHGNAGSVGKSLTDIKTETDKIQKGLTTGQFIALK